MKKKPTPPSPAPNTIPQPVRRSLADRVGKAFAPRACVLGYGIFARGGVAVESLDDAHATLLVASPGKRKRSVVLRARAGVLEVACTCGPHAPELACRHVWASILELDRRAGRFAGETALVLASATTAAAEEAPPKRQRKPRRASGELAEGC